MFVFFWYFVCFLFLSKQIFFLKIKIYFKKGVIFVFLRIFLFSDFVLSFVRLFLNSLPQQKKRIKQKNYKFKNIYQNH